MLTTAADDSSDPVRVVYTLRDDFVGHMPEIRHVFVLRRIDRAGLRRIVTAPIERLSYRFESDRIVDDMLNEIEGSPFELSLLQFACRQLWVSRDNQRKLLLEASYREHGGVAHALATHADGVLSEMSTEEQRLARQIFGRLVVGTTTRRTVEVNALVTRLPAGAVKVVDRLVVARLLVKQRVPGESSVHVEIAHESLLATWTQLRGWLEESGEERRLVLELEEAAAFWVKRGKRPEQTLGHDELVTARQRIARLGISLPDAVEAFLVAGDGRQRMLRRRRQVQRATVIGIAITVTAISLVLAGSFREAQNAAEAQAEALSRQAASLKLAAANKGRVELVVEAFDRPDVPAPLSELPALSIRLYMARPHDIHHPDQPLSAEFATVSRSQPGTFSVEAPGGMVFAQIDGRGRPGEACAASWIRIEALPGYAAREQVPRVELRIPTCRASAAGSVTIPEGDFIYGGPGEPATRFHEYYDGVPEQVIWLDRFAIDRMEVSNDWFGPFASLGSTTGYAAPQYPEDGVSGLPISPATAIDAFEAEAFCRYMGKRLPTDHEWTKAARGGLRINRVDNPHPRRLYPWGIRFEKRCVNLLGADDGIEWVGAVDSMPCGASPYHLLHMAGNVGEWIAVENQAGPPTAMRIARGGAVNSPLHLEQTTTLFRNAREGRHFDFVTGIRCVTDGDPIRGSTWPPPPLPQIPRP
jgi:formylglycine-generating enzyme required for sulfatase activity